VPLAYGAAREAHGRPASGPQIAHTFERHAELHGVPDGRKQPGLRWAHDGASTNGVSRDGGKPARHALDEHDPERLAVGADQQYVGGAQHVRKAVVANRAEEGLSVGKADRGGAPPQLVEPVAAPHHEQV